MRSKITKRVVPRHRLEETLAKVPQSVRKLAPLVDFHAELHNGVDSDDIELVSSELNWTMFRQIWDQKCNIQKRDESISLNHSEDTQMTYNMRSKL